VAKGFHDEMSIAYFSFGFDLLAIKKAARPAMRPVRAALLLTFSKPVWTGQ
jgi:hypothetical protein